jgi:hypothetical protein
MKYILFILTTQIRINIILLCKHLKTEFKYISVFVSLLGGAMSKSPDILYEKVYHLI